jgi:hypothetical protein
MGCLAFTTAILCGLIANNPVETILVRALWGLFLFAALGWVLGGVAEIVLDEHVGAVAAKLVQRKDAKESTAETSTDEPAAEASAAGPARTTDS